VPTTKYAEYFQRYQKSFLAQVHKVSESIGRAAAKDPDAGDLTKIIAKMTRADDPELHDSWNTSLQSNLSRGHAEEILHGAQRRP